MCWRYSPTTIMMPSLSSDRNQPGSGLSRSRHSMTSSGNKPGVSPALLLQTGDGEGASAHAESLDQDLDIYKNIHRGIHDTPASSSSPSGIADVAVLVPSLTSSPPHFRDLRPPKPQDELQPGCYWVFRDETKNWVQMSRWQSESLSKFPLSNDQRNSLTGMPSNPHDHNCQEGNGREIQGGGRLK